jgi:spore maturation protein A
MLNYIWGGLIIFSLIFALVNDTNDIVRDNWRNGEVHDIRVHFPANADLSRSQQIRFTIGADTVQHQARWYPVDDEAELVIPVHAGLPEHWRAVAQNQQSSRKQELRVYVRSFSTEVGALEAGTSTSVSEVDVSGTGATGTGALEAGTSTETNGNSAGVDSAGELHERPRVSVTVIENGSGLEGYLQYSTQVAGVSGAMRVVLPEVHFVKLRAITAAAFELAEFAVTLALGLVGIMALWLGLMKIAEEAGLIHIVVKGVRPFMRWLFPELPKDHPAMGMISLNLAANVLGLGNAATPLGIKAMEELQKLNPEKDTATNSMVMFLALNTSSVQLLPPVTLVAIMGMRVNELMVAITLTTIFSTAAAIIAAKLYARRYPAVISDSGELLAVGIDSDGAAALESSAGEANAKPGSPTMSGGNSGSTLGSTSTTGGAGNAKGKADSSDIGKSKGPASDQTNHNTTK